MLQAAFLRRCTPHDAPLRGSFFHTVTGMLCLWLCPGQTLEAIGLEIANSINEFSLTQGQNGWTYGIFDQTAHGAAYGPDHFALFDVPDAPSNSWKASTTLVPAPSPDGRDNTFFLNINAVGGHPTGIDIDGQNRIVWAMRRYTSEAAGVMAIRFDAHKLNTVNPNGGGITARIFLEGQEILTQFIANDDGLGVQGTLTIPVVVGSRIDFAIDPLGVVSPRDGVYSPRADGSHFSAILEIVPEPTSATLAGLIAFFALRRRARHAYN